MAPGTEADGGGRGGDGAAPAYLVKGRRRRPRRPGAPGRCSSSWSAGRDPALVVEEHGGSSVDELDVGGCGRRLTTPPFLVDRRVVVVRDAGRLDAADAARLVDVPRGPPALHRAGARGRGRDGARRPGQGGRPRRRGRRRRGRRTRGDRGPGGWPSSLNEAPVRLDARPPPALERSTWARTSAAWRGSSRPLAAAYGEGATVGADELEPFLGEAGSVPPWDLTDAIDAGTRPPPWPPCTACSAPAGGRAPSSWRSCTGTSRPCCRLDGADVARPEDAAALLGLRSTYPAKKALRAVPPAGPRAASQAVTLIADADLDVRGRARSRGDWCSRSSWPGSAGWSRPAGDRRGAAAERAAGSAQPSASSALPPGASGGTCGWPPGSCGSRPGPPPCRSAARPGATRRRRPRLRPRHWPRRLGPRPQLRADRLVAQAAPLVLAVALDLAPDVGHVGSSARVPGGSPDPKVHDVPEGPGRSWADRRGDPPR